MKALFIASEVRSGSTYAAEAIAYSFAESFGVECWGLAHEKFAVLNGDCQPAKVRAILNELFINQAGFRCSKLMVKDLTVIFRAIDEDETIAEDFLSSSCAWIIVRKKNKFRQAVSLSYAEASGVYHNYTAEDSAPDYNISISPQDVKRRYLALAASDDYLSLFATKARRSVTIFHEDFVEDPLSTIKHIISSLNLPFDSQAVEYSTPKITPTAQTGKRQLEKDFREYFLRNF